MQLPSHYPPYLQKTLIVVTNNEMAKLFVANKRRIKEVGDFSIDCEDQEDERMVHERVELYANVNNHITKFIGEDAGKRVILCAPEARKDELLEVLEKDTKELIDAFVPKNLASLPVEQIVRILQETNP